MSKKIYIGLFVGITTGAAVSIFLNLKRNERLFSLEDLGGENEMLDKANHFLLLARNKVEEMVLEAQQRSSSIIQEAGKLLLLSKQKTSEMHQKLLAGENEEAEKIKADLDELILEFKNKL
ncbi:MAG: hypothetical protein ABIY50_08985 [Ignavibacteria bacterium]